MNIGDVLKRAGVVAGVTAGVAGAMYAGERALVARIRHRSDEDGDATLFPEVDGSCTIDTHDGGALYTVWRGHGPPVVFAHGVTLSSRLWAKQFATIPDAGFRAVAYDSRGHGDSTCGTTGHSVDNLADDLRAVLLTLDLRDAVLVGHSMGGMAVQAFAIRHPDVLRERVRGVVLMSTASRNLLSHTGLLRFALDRATGVTPDLGAFMRQRNFGLLLARIGFGEDPRPSHIEATRQMLGACSRDTIRDAVRALLTLDLTKGLERVEVPALVLQGTADPLTSSHDAQVIADHLPRARLVEFEGAGHMLMYERTEEVDALIVDFARQCVGRSTDKVAPIAG